MCNLYSLTKGQQAILQLSRAMRDTTGNLPPLPGIFPDYPAPIVRTASDGVRELALVRWCMPSSKKALLDAATRRADKLRAKGQEVVFEELLKMESDGGTTNVRNTSSPHWKRWLEPKPVWRRSMGKPGSHNRAGTVPSCPAPWCARACHG